MRNILVHIDEAETVAITVGPAQMRETRCLASASARPLPMARVSAAHGNGHVLLS
ncbi:MAG: hypothetical protein JO188_04630 [Hyphomicrobiales bacterium]|nr:hypothetical protein [Hyphomicrobiales bacterium]